MADRMWPIWYSSIVTGTIRIKSRIRNGNRIGRRREAYIKVRFKRTVYRLISAKNALNIEIPMKELYHEET